MTFDQALERICRSAKRRFDYLTWERPSIELMGTVHGSRVASNIVLETIVGHADGKSAEAIAAELNTQILLCGLKADFTDECKMISTVAEKELGAFVMLRAFQEMGMVADDAFRDVSKDLLTGIKDPSEAEREALEKLCLKPIIESAKKSIDRYDDFVEKERQTRPDAAVGRLENILRISLGFFSAPAEFSAEEVLVKLVEMMKEGSEPVWLLEFLEQCKKSTAKEICTMDSLNIGWEYGMKVDRIAEEVAFRLAH